LDAYECNADEGFDFFDVENSKNLGE